MIAIPKPAQKLMIRLEHAGQECYLVGGCVRDALLGRVPVDLDFCTSALPEQMKDLFADYPLVLNGEKHGTVGVITGGKCYEITTFRTESSYDDHRHPNEVCFVRSLEEDLKRRDFTINAMAYHPEKGIIDPCGGQDDLGARVLRCVGEPEKRFEEDALRILRGLRFAAVLGFEVEPGAKQAIFAKYTDLEKIAPQRILEEMKKILAAPFAAEVLREFREVFAFFLQDFPKEDGAWEELCAQIERSSANLAVRAVLLLAQLDAKQIQTLAKTYFLGAKWAKNKTALANRMKAPAPQTEAEILRLLKDFGEEDARLLLDCFAAKEQNPAKTRERNERFAVLAKNGCYKPEHLQIGAKELMALGYHEKEIGSCLQTLLDLVIEGRLANEKRKLQEYAASEKGR